MANFEWMICIDNKVIGPFTSENVAALLTVGRLFGTDFIWCQGMKSWILIRDCERFKVNHPAAPRVPIPRSLEDLPGKDIGLELDLGVSNGPHPRTAPRTEPRTEEVALEIETGNAGVATELKDMEFGDRTARLMKAQVQTQTQNQTQPQFQPQPQPQPQPQAQHRPQAQPYLQQNPSSASLHSSDPNTPIQRHILRADPPRTEIKTPGQTPNPAISTQQGLNLQQRQRPAQIGFERDPQVIPISPGVRPQSHIVNQQLNAAQSRSIPQSQSGIPQQPLPNPRPQPSVNPINLAYSANQTGIQAPLSNPQSAAGNGPAPISLSIEPIAQAVVIGHQTQGALAVRGNTPDQDPTRIRQHKRIGVESTNIVTSHGAFEVLNISEGGLFAKSNGEIMMIGTELKFSLKSSKIPESLLMMGTVVRRSGVSETQLGFAIEFVFASEPARDQFRQYIKSVLNSKIFIEINEYQTDG